MSVLKLQSDQFGTCYLRRPILPEKTPSSAQESSPGLSSGSQDSRLRRGAKPSGAARGRRVDGEGYRSLGGRSPILLFRRLCLRHQAIGSFRVSALSLLRLRPVVWPGSMAPSRALARTRSRATGRGSARAARLHRELGAAAQQFGPSSAGAARPGGKAEEENKTERGGSPRREADPFWPLRDRAERRRRSGDPAFWRVGLRGDHVLGRFCNAGERVTPRPTP